MDTRRCLRSKSAGVAINVLIHRPMKLNRCNSMPKRICSTCILAVTPSPRLCRWSSAPACEGLLVSPLSMTPTRARSIRNLRILPPRQPTRKSGTAEELRSALPPRVPQRKPGMATMESNALPPFMPKRYLDDSFENLSVVSSFTTISSRSDDEGGCHHALGDSPGEILLSASGSLNGSNSDLMGIRIKQVLGEAVDHLEAVGYF